MREGYTLTELTYVAGALVGALFSGYGADHFVYRLIGHRWGDMSELAGGAFFVLVLTLAEKGAFLMRNERLIREGKPPHSIFRN